MFNALVKGSLILAIIFTVVLTAAFMYAYEEITLDADKLIHYTPETSSVILDRNGKKLAYIFKEQHRLYARYDEIPGFLIEGLVAMEDTRFFEHNGVNPDAILRAIVKDIKAGSFVEGGSTLTQQLIKNKLLSNEKKLVRKIKEAILALKIEHELSKEQILERYLNEISYGNNYFGVKTAANGYFHKEMNELTHKEMAILVGLPNAPSFYNPIRHYKRALNRANNVLYRMKSIGWIGQDDYLKAVKESPTVYKTSLTQNIAPYIVDEVLRRFRGRLADIRTGGYQIYTTIDMKQQAIARKAVNFNHKRVLQKYHEDINTTKLNAAFVAVESSTGDILAMVGGENYKRSAFNRVTQSKRQPGSAFKPFIYQTALDMGYNPATPLTDLARTFEYYANGRRKVWRPKNAEHNFKGFISLREALVHSRNLATINLVDELGLKTIRDRLAFLDVPHIPKDMSIALGNLGLSPLKMAQIFSVFANKGHMIEARLVSKIIAKEGAVIYETRPKEIADFTTPQQAYLMTDILKDVIKYGTGKKAAVKGVELAGKTGTTNNYVDAWFCGYSPTIEVISWVGRDDNKPIGKFASGGSVAAPAFAYYFEELYKLYPKLPRSFPIPEYVLMDTYKGKNELYTYNSPLPRAKNIQKTYKEYLNEDNETISLEEETEFMETLHIEDDLNESKADALHPARKVPLRPVSEDSGELF
jgi:penicillin-binding protein 1A